MANLFESLCGDDPLLDVNALWNNSYPQFTQCFQDTVLTWFPCGLLWLSAPFYTLYLSNGSHNSFPSSRLFITKVLCSMLIIITAIDILKSATNDDVVYTKAQQLAQVLRICSYALSIFLMVMERRKSLFTSGVLFVFWLLLGIVDIIPCYTQIMQQVYDKDVLGFGLFFIQWMFILSQFVLQCFAEQIPVSWNIAAETEPNPEEFASVLSRLTFWWVNRLVRKGYKKTLQEKDVWDLHPKDKNSYVLSHFEHHWYHELDKLRRQTAVARYNSNQTEVVLNEKTPLLNRKHEVNESSPKSTKVRTAEKNVSLFCTMIRVYGAEMLLSWCCKYVYDVLKFIPPLLLSALIEYTDKRRMGQEWEWKGYVYALSFFVVSVLMSIGYQQNFHIGRTLGMRMKSALTSAIYKKSLLIDNYSRSLSTVGEIVNLTSVDCQRVQDFAGYLWMLTSAPVEVTLALILLWNQLGPSTLAGLCVMLLLIPVNATVALKQRRLQIELMKHKDTRVKLLSEVLNGIKVLKLNAWELSFQDKVTEIRNKELGVLKKYAYLQSFNMFSYTCAPTLVSLASFMTYILSSEDNHLDAAKAFVSLSLFNILKYPINLLPMIVSFAIQANVSIGRIRRFLVSSELCKDNVERLCDNSVSENAIDVENGNFTWEQNSCLILKTINLHIKRGQLVAVVGQVGCGKSSLLSAVLGEMEKVDGRVKINGKTAYVSQQAWIQNATLRDNVLFGSLMDKSKYDNVIDACALTPDLQILPGEDLTEIGEKGINLSGGQKQRVSLARAVYNDTDIYLLDDPLSAVDSHVGKHIFRKVIGPKGLLQYKTRVLVTHGVHWLPMVDTIVVLVDGRISDVGSYEDLMSHDGPFAQFLKTHLMQQQDCDDEAEDDIEIQQTRQEMLERVESLTSSDGTSSNDDNRPSGRKVKRRKAKNHRVYKKDYAKKVHAESSRLIQEETSESGQVKMTVFLTYIRAIGILSTVVIFVIYTCSQSANVAASIWLSFWTEDKILLNRTLSGTACYKTKNNMYLSVYAAFGISQAGIVLVYSFLLNLRLLQASGKLHSAMLKSVIRSTLQFFDTTPVGRILNRFSRDVETVDTKIPNSLSMWINILFNTLSTLVVITYSTPIFVSTAVPIAVCYYFIQRYYAFTSRQLQRMESTTRSPIYTHFSETISGAATIRAYGHQERFIKECQDRVDKCLTFYSARMVSNRWLGTRLELLGNLVVFAAVVFTAYSPDISGGTVGLSVSYALQVTFSLNMFVRIFTEFETDVVSVERLKEYSEINSEACLTSETALSPQWPNKGQITYTDYSTRYRSGLDLTLNGITFNIKSGEKIGIVGRTGAGKSSLTLSLFRLIEPAGGAIFVDGVNISDLGLHDLRSKITILPQDPVLFSGTLRMNLDPFNQYSDELIWKAIEHAHLKTFISDQRQGLTFQCGEGGQNLSVGQKQLICLARTLLRKTKILILDEATAAVDMETDNLIQQTLRSEFKDCTVLSVAHRLNTIQDYDKIMVLDQGYIREFDTPSTLLADKSSLFHSMARDANLI